MRIGRRLRVISSSDHKPTPISEVGLWVSRKLLSIIVRPRGERSVVPFFNIAIRFQLPIFSGSSVGRTTDRFARSDASSQKLRKIADHDIGALRFQFRRVVFPGDPDHESKSASRAGLNA